jgi:hypothetical protein
MNQTQKGSTVILPVGWRGKIGQLIDGGRVMKIFHPTPQQPYLFKFGDDVVKICYNTVAVIWEGELTEQGGFYVCNH